jgi:hypothetical protein
MLPGHVATRSVGVGRDHPELLSPARQIDHRRRRRHRHRGHPRRRSIEPGALLDPPPDHLVTRLLRAREQPAGVGHGRGRLEEHQAVVGAGEVHPPAAMVVGEGPEVEGGVVAPERELEPVLAFRGPVAGALVAAQPRQHRVDVADEVDVGHRRGVPHAHGERGLDRGRPVAEHHPHGRRAGGDRPHEPAGADRAERREVDRRVGGRLEADGAGEIHPAAVGERAGDHELGRREGPVEHHLGGLDRERRDRRRRCRFRRDRRLGRPRQGRTRARRRLGVESRHGKGPPRAAALGVEQPHRAIGAGHGHVVGERAEGRGVGHRPGQADFRELLRRGGAVVVERLPLRVAPLAAFRAALAGNLGHDVEDVLGHVRLEAVARDHQLARAVEAAGRRDPPAVGGKPQAEHAAGDRMQRENQVGVVADHPLGMPVDAVGPRRAVGAGRHDVLEHGVPVDGLQAAPQRARRDRGHVVDESLRRQLGELDRHVAAHRDHVVSLGREHRVEHPVLVRALEEHLRSRRGVDRPHRVVGAAEADELAVGRPAAAVDGVEGDGHRPQERAVGHVPDLHLAHPRRVAAGDGQPRAVG